MANEVILYIKKVNGIVEEVFGSYDELKEKDGYIKVPHLNINISDPITWYDENWNRIEFEERVEKGIEEIPRGMKINDARDGFMPKEQLEKWLDGDEELPNTMKFNTDKTNVEAKTQKELFADGIITEEYYAETIRQERDILIAQIENSKEYKMLSGKALTGDVNAMNAMKVFEEKKQILRDIPQTKNFPNSFTGFGEFSFN